MTCFSPLHAYKAKSEDAQKVKIVFRRPDSWRGVQLDLPCGQCIGCRLERSRQWAVRCIHEASLHDENSFLTLTYDDAHIPKDRGLVVRDVQLFMKRLRKSVAPKRVRFFLCGEYGDSETKRPHYHALLFGHSFSDRKFYSRGREFPLYTSESLQDLWPQGHCLIGEVSFESAGYVARYSLKKVTGERAAEYYQGRKAPFVTMSRRPGIGQGWYEKYKADVYPLDRVVVRGHSTRPPRFYDRLLGLEDRSTLEWLKLKRERENQHFVTDTLSDGKVVLVSDSSGPRLAVKEVVKLAEISTLKRHLE